MEMKKQKWMLEIDNGFNTPTEYILEFNFTKESLEEGKEALRNWDQRAEEFYKSEKEMIHKRFNYKEAEHYRNVIKYWEKKLNNED